MCPCCHKKIDRQRCEKCEKDGLKDYAYRVWTGSRTTTLVGGGSYQDERGQHHLHDMNTISVEYLCSNGHTWSMVAATHCPNPGCTWRSRP